MQTQALAVGAVMYPGFEMLDLFGPLEMLSLLGPQRVRIHMLAESDTPVPTAMGQAVEAGPRLAVDATFADAPELDILLVPGGFGTLPQLENETLLAFLAARGERARFLCSVCTGSLLLARAGLLEGRRATTNKQFFALTSRVPAQTEWVQAARWVVDGNRFTSSGVSAGMDMTLALIAEVWDEATATEVADSAEYSWHRDADSDPFLSHLNAGARAMGLL